MRAFTTATRALACAVPQKIRPEFSLGEDNQPGPQGREIRSNRESEIQREVEDAVLSKMLLCQLLARGRGG